MNANNLYSAYDVSGLSLEISGSYFVENGYLETESADNEIKVYIEMFNKNSFDASNLEVSFVIAGEESLASFSDLDRNEKGYAVYTVEVPEGLETGKYALEVYVTNDDLSYSEVVNLEITSLGDSIDYKTVSTSEPVVKTFWENLMDFLKSIF